VSAIFGIVDFSGRPIAPDRFEAMREAIAYYGPDGAGAWHGPGAAIGQLLLDAGAGAGALADPAPFVFGEQVAVAAARLDNRDELVAELGLSPGLSDGAICAHAWRTWGDAAPPHLFGDWSFAAWDAQARRLLIARDHFGNSAIYYHWDGSRLTFGSSRKALFAWPHVPRRLNELRLAQHLATWITDGAATLHEGINRLPPGHVLTADAGGISVSRYWYPERVAALTFRRDEDYVERFLELYDAAVRRRVRGAGVVATTLSAGLDSGSVTALAAREAARTGQRLVAFTARPRFAPTAPSPFLLDEWPLAQACARHIGIEDHRPVVAARITPLEAMRRSLEAHDEPEYAAANLDWIHDILGSAREAGARILLTGQVGNGGVSWTGDRQAIAKLAVRGRMVAAATALREHASAARISLARAAWRQLVRPLAALAPGAARRGPPDQGLINAAFAKRIGLRERMRESAADAPNPRLLPPRDQRLRILLPEINPVGALWHESGAAYGLDVRDPTADVRLLEFCLAIPDAQFRLGGEERSLIKRAMAGLMPEAVLRNPRAGRQAADFTMRLHADRAEVDAAVAAIGASAAAREYLDLPALERRWRRIREDAENVPLAEAYAFGRSLLFGLFLAGA